MLRPAGLLSECLALASRPISKSADGRALRAGSHPSTTSIGYRQGLEALARWAREDARWISADDNNNDDECEDENDDDNPNPAVTGDEVRALAASVASATRTLVRRQTTWFRGNGAFTWVDLGSGEGSSEELRVAEDRAAAAVMAIWDATPDDAAAVAAARSSGAPAAERLTKEEEQQLKRYVTKWTILAPGSEGELAARREAARCARAWRRRGLG